jgi:hypothetical protein
MDTPLMEPYIQFHMSISKPNADVSACLAQIAKIPLHDRYVWRIASALQWGFADYDSGSVRVDRDTLTPEEREKVSRLLTDRPGQFCRFLSAWFGADKMAQLMIEAIADAKQRG